jgi:hypothetical protein
LTSESAPNAYLPSTIRKDFKLEDNKCEKHFVVDRFVYV